MNGGGWWQAQEKVFYCPLNFTWFRSHSFENPSTRSYLSGASILHGRHFCCCFFQAPFTEIGPMLEWEKCTWTALWPELPAPYYGDVIGALKENNIMWPISQSFSIAKAFEHGQVVWDAVELNHATRASTLKTQPFGAPFEPNVTEMSYPMGHRIFKADGEAV